MGRSPRNPASLVAADGRAPDETGVWQVVRRALGRLAARAVVREGEIGVPLPPVCRSPATDFGALSADCSAVDWRPGVQIWHFTLPNAGPGGGGRNLAALAPVVRTDAVLPDCALPVRAVALGSALGRAQVWPSEEWRVPNAAVSAPVLTLSGGSSCTLSDAVLRLPAVAALSVGISPLPPARSALDVCARIPWERMRLSAPPGMSFDAAFEPERARLAAAARLPLEDILLTGVFPRIPISAIRGLAMSEGEAVLQFWFKPESFGGPPPRLVTLLLGRRRSTGALLRAVL